jgi:phosphatidylglycerol:prolipoprotein diacylglycerol transferase
MPNRLLAVIDIREGGLEFLGGFLGAAIAVTAYGVIRRQSLRLFLDILAPSAMWGLAFGRVGCFLNGCCFGGLAIQPGTQQAAYPWSVRFPFASPAEWKQWEDRQVALPAELINVDKNTLQATPLPDKALNMPYEKRERLIRDYSELSERYKKALTENPKDEETKKLAAAFEAAQRNLQSNQSELLLLARAERFPSRVEPSRPTSASEIERLAAQNRSLPVHPTQLYASTGALLLSGLLSAIYYRRKRHGVVIAALFMLYPVQRFFEEIIRVDNPLDSAGLTVSQFIGVAMFVVGATAMFCLYRYFPERSPLAERARIPQT